MKLRLLVTVETTAPRYFKTLLQRTVLPSLNPRVAGRLPVNGENGQVHFLANRLLIGTKVTEAKG